MSDYYTADGTPITEYELETQFDEMLDDVYGDIEIFGRYHYSYSRAVESLDPILYREAFLEYVDGLLTDSELFETDPTEDSGSEG
jgi:hypothetical protein